MLRYLAAIGGAAAIFILYEIVIYGWSAFLLERSKTWQSDLGYCCLLAIPLVILEFLWLRGWRLGMDGGLSPWATDVLYLVCAVIGSSIAMLIYFKTLPNIPQLIGLALVLIGGIVVVMCGGGK